MRLGEIRHMPPAGNPPTEPVVPCLRCHRDFVWWVHPVQLCDDCVALEYAEGETEGDPGMFEGNP